VQVNKFKQPYQYPEESYIFYIIITSSICIPPYTANFMFYIYHGISNRKILWKQD